MFGFEIPQKWKKFFGAPSEDDGILTTSVDFSDAGDSSGKDCGNDAGGDSGSCDSGGGGDGGGGD
jgi:hypothetical protein